MATLKAMFRFLWKEEGQESLQTPTTVQQEFVLMYKSLEVGTLSINEGIWTFAYSENFKIQTDIRPLWDFSDINRIYRFDYLPPFFLQRIPSLEQPKVKEVLKKENIDAHNEVALLKRFGRATISNPYLLNAV
jgi:HipA-like protein